MSSGDARWRVDQRELAKALFGRPLRYMLAAFILSAAGEPVSQSEAQLAMELWHAEARSGTLAELKLLADWGLITRVQPERRIYWLQVDSGLWTAFEAVLTALAVDWDTDQRTLLPASLR